MDRDRQQTDTTGMLAFFQQALEQSVSQRLVLSTATGRIGAAKADRLFASLKGLTTRHVIKDAVQVSKAGKEFIVLKPYTRVIARLSSEPDLGGATIPPFNPLTLYTSAKGSGAASDPDANAAGSATTRVEDLVGGLLPDEDGLEISKAEVVLIVARALEDAGNEDDASSTDATAASPGAASDAQTPAQTAAALPAHTTAIEKSFGEDDAEPAIEGQEVSEVQIAADDTLAGALKRNGIDAGQARAVAEAAKAVLDSDKVAAGQILRLTLTRSPTDESKMQPMRVSLFDEGHSHLVTVARAQSGEFVASENPLTANLTEQLRDLGGGHQPASLYTSLYAAALSQGMPEDMIMRLIRVFAYDVDFRRRVGPGDGFEAFFDMVGDDKAGMAAGAGPAAGRPDQLLYAALTVGGETRRFFRYRAADGSVDFYDGQGSNSKKFLILRPVRGENVRFTSGFGVRMHPLLHINKMHTGVDWASAIGTPILAAGNGVIDEIGRKGGNGNYIRIRHANGYKTAYGHMQKFAAGVSPGVKVRQGQIIGYVGSTGLSSGPHVHYEVLINNSFVDPNSIQVPRERQLEGRLLAEFKRERLRIDELMRRNPVSTRMASATER